MKLSFEAIDPTWRGLVEFFFKTRQGMALFAELNASTATIYPSTPFRALELTALPAVRVVILGQDPYHGAGQAQGLAFSVPENCRVPPSLRNIQKEFERDLHRQAPTDLSGWAHAGVLLLNTILTVEEAKPLSHKAKGWEQLTQSLIDAVAKTHAHTAYLLWGAHAQSYAPRIRALAPDSLILEANHPSPLSALRPPVPFIGCGHFSKVEQWLAQHGSCWHWPAASG